MSLFFPLNLGLPILLLLTFFLHQFSKIPVILIISLLSSILSPLNLQNFLLLQILLILEHFQILILFLQNLILFLKNHLLTNLIFHLHLDILLDHIDCLHIVRTIIVSWLQVHLQLPIPILLVRLVKLVRYILFHLTYPILSSFLHIKLLHLRYPPTKSLTLNAQAVKRPSVAGSHGC